MKTSRITPGLTRFLRYASVGISTLLFDLGMLYVAVSIFGLPVYIATPLTFLIAVSCNYALSRRYVFQKTERGWIHGYGYFAIVAIIGALVTTTLVEALVTYAGLFYLIARVLVAGIVGIGNYLFNLYLNFKVVGKHN